MTVIPYNGAGGNGHIGFVVAPAGQTISPGNTIGYYPASYGAGALFGEAPGALHSDAGETAMNGVPNTITIPTTAQQDAAMTASLINRGIAPGQYGLFANGDAENCAIAAEDTLRDGGLIVPTTTVPTSLMNILQQTYSKDKYIYDASEPE